VRTENVTARNLYGWVRQNVSARNLHGWLRDVGLLAGSASVVYGVAQWSRPAAWITAGLALVLLSVAASRAAGRDQQRADRAKQTGGHD